MLQRCHSGVLTLRVELDFGAPWIRLLSCTHLKEPVALLRVLTVFREPAVEASTVGSSSGFRERGAG